MRNALTAAITLLLLWAPSAALAQTSPNPTAPPPQPFGGWTIWQGIGAIILGGLFLFGLVGAYLKFAPTFYGTDKKPEDGRRRLPPGARTAAALALQQPQALAASPQAPPAPARQAAAPGQGAASAAQATQTAPPKPEAPPPAAEVKAKEEEQSAPAAPAEEPQAAAPSEAEAAERDEQPSVEQEKPSGQQQPDARGAENVVESEEPADKPAETEAPAETETSAGKPAEEGEASTS